MEQSGEQDLVSFANKKAIKRVLIIGVSSYIGSALASGLREDFDVVGTYYKSKIRIDGVTAFELDAVDGNRIFEIVKMIAPDAVFFCPGQQDIDKVQSNVEEADNLHTKAPALFFKLPVSNFHFIYFSSDQVFGNSANENQMPPFTEINETAPINAYAQTKLQGENLVKSQTRFTHVLRLSEVFGEPFGTGTFNQKRKTWIEAVRAHLEAGNKLHFSDEEYRSPLYIGDLVRAMKTYLKSVGPELSLHHLASKDMISRYQFAKNMAKHLGFDSDLILKSSDNEKILRAARPRNCALSSAKFENDFKFEFQNSEQGIREMAERLRYGYTKNWN